MICETIETSATVFEVNLEGSIRLRIGAPAPGHQHRIRFDVPAGTDVQPFRDAMLTGKTVRVWIEIPPTESRAGRYPLLDQDLAEIRRAFGRCRPTLETERSDVYLANADALRILVDIIPYV